MTCRERSKSEITRFDRSSEGELTNKYEVVSRQAVADHFLAFRWNRAMSSSPETQTVFEVPVPRTEAVQRGYVTHSAGRRDR